MGQAHAKEQGGHMITRLHIDNFRCLINFDLELDEANLLLGANGSGKTSVLDALRKLQALIAHGSKIEDVFPAKDLSMNQDRGEQRFELEMQLGEQSYRYALMIDHDRDRARMRIGDELLEHDGRPLFRFRNGTAQLYHDDYAEGPSYPFDWTLSGIGLLNERSDNQKLTRFKKEIANFIIASPCPPIIESETRTEDDALAPLMQNFPGWYRHMAQENMGSLIDLFSELRKALPGFDSILLTESGENARALKAVFQDPSARGGSSRYGFDQLSDGQRSLIVLYSLIFLSGNRRVSLFIDEPDNYLSLREIQPWVARVVEGCGETVEQAVIVSHHPVIIDYMAGAGGRWFFRDGHGPARVSEEPMRSIDGLSLSETIARGWEE